MYKLKQFIKKIVTKLNNIFYTKYVKYFKNYLRLSSTPFISGDTFRSFSKHKFDESSKINIGKMKENDIVFVKTDFLEQFIENYMHDLPDKIKLITHNSDINITENLIHSIESKKIHWFAQNLLLDSDSKNNIHFIPIGFENRNWFKNGKLNNLKNIEIPTEKINKLFVGFNTNTNSERVTALSMLDKNDTAVFFRRAPHKKYMEEMSKYKLALCPEGNGVDTHRIWESLLVRTLPVMKKSKFSTNLISNGVPVFLIEDWSDLNNLTEEQIFDIYNKNLSSLTDVKVLYSKYWLELIEKIK